MKEHIIIYEIHIFELEKDHRSNIHNLSRRENKAWKKIKYGNFVVSCTQANIFVR